MCIAGICDFFLDDSILILCISDRPPNPSKELALSTLNDTWWYLVPSMMNNPSKCLFEKERIESVTRAA